MVVAAAEVTVGLALIVMALSEHTFG